LGVVRKALPQWRAENLPQNYGGKESTMNRQVRLFATVAVLAAVLLAGPTSARAQKANIVETAQAAGQFNTLLAAAKAAGLADALAEGGPFTVFAPTDDAFKKLPAGTVETLLKPENKDKLAAILKYHVVPGKVRSGQVLRAKRADSLLGPTILFRAAKGEVMADGARIVQTDIQASNGIIHVIDAVILPQTTAQRLAGNEQFSTLVAAAKAADLVSPLAGSDKLTVFAPTNAAFGKLPKGTVQTLLEPDNKDKLAAILKYHVVAGSRTFGRMPLSTLQGQNVAISAGKIRVNGVKVSQADIITTNGVIHQIDRVLLPAMSDGKASAQAEHRKARKLIEQAIAKGVPLFNHGNPAACAKVYTSAARDLLAMDAMPGSSRKTLTAALHTAGKMHHAGREAWVLRRALDSVHEDLGSALARMEE
jgi:uncharacterized surface protein with fasciclin (FAS1) repeats